MKLRVEDRAQGESPCKAFCSIPQYGNTHTQTYILYYIILCIIYYLYLNA